MSDKVESMEENEQNADLPHKKRRRHRKKQLYSSILKQMEFYFSDAALSKDRFLSQLVSKNPFVDLEVFLRFNKIKALTDNISDISVALQESKLLEVSEDNLKVKRVTPCVPYDADSRTVYVESIPPLADLPWLSNVFQVYGNVAYVSMPKYNNTNRIKGFAFVEYEKEEEAIKCLEGFTVMGCKLPTNIKAETLSSYQGFQPIVPDPKLPGEVGKLESDSENQNQSNESIAEPPAKKIKKNSISQDNNETECTSTGDVAAINIDLNSKDDVMEESAVEHSGSANEQEPVAMQEASNNKVKAVRKRKKKDRNKTNKEREKKHLEMTSRSLKVLSKIEWKILRNKYLNLQRKHMKSLKQVLRTQHAVPENMNKIPKIIGAGVSVYNEHANETESSKKKIMKDLEIPFKEGIIVYVRLTEPCTDVRAFKKATKENIHVQFVDVKEGQSNIHIRLDDPDAAKQMASSGIFPEARVLEGKEEKEYWEVLKKQQYEKAASKRKVRGRDRLVRKAQQLVESIGQAGITTQGKHIRFDD